MILWVSCIIGAYLVGSIPFGVMIGRARGVNIREVGSKNIGATNVSRVLGRKLGILCFALDFLKGAVPVLVAGALAGTLSRSPIDPDPLQRLSQTDMWLWLAVAAAAVLGHMFSIFLGFRGGKGVATGFGAMVAMWPLLTWPAVAALVVWYVTLRLFKYVSVASMLAVISLPISYLISNIPNLAQDQPVSRTIDQLSHAYPPFVGTLMIAMLVVYQHRGNIARLRRGTEPKTGEKIAPKS